jgi:hypothetical protein
MRLVCCSARRFDVGSVKLLVPLLNELTTGESIWKCYKSHVAYFTDPIPCSRAVEVTSTSSTLKMLASG